MSATTRSAVTSSKNMSVRMSPASGLLVGPERLTPGRAKRRSDQELVQLVEVDPACDAIVCGRRDLALTERHDDERAWSCLVWQRAHGSLDMRAQLIPSPIMRVRVPGCKLEIDKRQVIGARGCHGSWERKLDLAANEASKEVELHARVGTQSRDM